MDRTPVDCSRGDRAAIAHADQGTPGRTCPMHYLYSPTSLARAADLRSDTLYVVGGLYGNPLALDALNELIARERGPVSVVFNGDFHWFDHEPALFRAISERVLEHTAIRGNVETELRATDETAGCGCAYPQWIDDVVVERSNAIENALRRTARQFPEFAQRTADLPMNLVAQVGDARIAIVHGDGVSLAGWGFSRRALASVHGVQRAAQWLHAANADVFACTHTCEPVCMRLEDNVDDGRGNGDANSGADRHGVIINNGAAGMPNFRGTRYGVVTRIATQAASMDMPALYGTRIAGIHVEALALRYDHEQWWRKFETLWPPGSPAHLSYGARIRGGGELDLAAVVEDPDS